MKAEIVTIGDELLVGQVIDTNSAFIARELNKEGIQIHRIVSVADTIEDVKRAVNESLERNKIVIITGGLGPTNDDCTKLALCEVFDTQLVFNEKVFANIQQIITNLNAQLNEHNRRQADVPASALVINNNYGTAPALMFEKRDSMLFCLPGVPIEMEQLLINEVIPIIKKRFKLPAIVHKHFMVQGIFEAALSVLLDDFEKSMPANMKLAYLPGLGLIRLRLSIYGEEVIKANELANEYADRLELLIKPYIVGYGEQTIENIIAGLLTEKGYTVSTAESCTGGNIARLLTSIPGSSKYFKGALVAYDNEIKENILGVSPETIARVGAVSKEVVETMADNCRRVMNTDFAIAVSGIAGPDGGTDEKPVGTVWIALATPEKIFSEKFNFSKGREKNIQRASVAALNLLRKNI